MKKFTVLFAAALALALFAGLFASCDAGEDNSALVAAYQKAAQTEREAAEYVKLISIGTMVTMSDNTREEGYVYEKPGSRKWDANKENAEFTFVAVVVATNYQFDHSGSKFTVKADSTDITNINYATSGSQTTITFKVPKNTKLVRVDGDNCFVSN